MIFYIYPQFKILNYIAIHFEMKEKQSNVVLLVNNAA